MSPTIEGLLILLIINANFFFVSKTFGWFESTHSIAITKMPELKHKAEIGSQDNIYTELAAGKHAQAAQKNLDAQHVALKVAETNQATEKMRLERVRLEKEGSA